MYLNDVIFSHILVLFRVDLKKKHEIYFGNKTRYQKEKINNKYKSSIDWRHKANKVNATHFDNSRII